MRRFTYFLAAIAVIVSCAAVAWRHRRPTLPYRDRFAQGIVSEWTPFGGVWRLRNGILTNRSDEGGAKLVTGSPRWRDYQVTADVQLHGSDGDVGIVVDASALRNGVDALRGYYATLRTETDALVLGIADNNHLDTLPQRLPQGVRRGAWYRLRMIVVGCRMAAEVRDLATGQATAAALAPDPAHCFTEGRIALRSNYGGGAWRNLHVERATNADLDVLLRESGPALRPEFPGREDRNAQVWDTYFAHREDLTPEVPSWVHENESRREEPAVLEVSAARSLAVPSHEVRLRGTVTSAVPAYLQDATAGIRLQPPTDDSLNVGDEIEAVGQLKLLGNEQVLLATNLRLLWDRTPLAPVSISPAQASSGQLDGSLVELSGRLLATDRLPDGATLMHLENSSQGFTLRLAPDLFDHSHGRWATGSTLRARGICTPADDPITQGAFTLLVAAASDVQLLSGPPWWSGWRLGVWIALALIAAAAGVDISIRIERSKMRAILEERERLAHDMHDTLAQSFAGVAYFLQGVRKSLVDAGVPQPQVQDVTLACEMVAGAHREASASIAALHPGGPIDGDLLNILERAAQSMLEGRPFPIVLRREGTPRRLSAAITGVLFQVGREAISNVLRHAQATQIILTLRFERRGFSFSVMDDGVGMGPDTAAWGFGLQGIQRRCAGIRARFEVRSTPGQGCTVEVYAPYAKRPRLWDALHRRNTGAVG